jgi:hypothetical protein
VVEAEPDCKVAMDILGFALYHENNGNVDGATSKSNTLPEDESDSSVENDEIGYKRQRLDEEGNSSSSAIKAKIWDEITAGDGQLPLEDACPAMDDHDRVMKAIEEMVSEGRVMEDDGILYTID